ncbi:THUMP-like domain-containing protein [Winogradskyella rapida]|uniref:Class I SAM-dependent methyltransferase n=1 Tax=Winogradskyella rapida TaxID=549701 RepID=A0ABW3KPI4_9FLAO
MLKDALLQPQVQDYINQHLNADPTELLLRGLPFEDIDPKLIIEQIEAKKRCEKKLPTWYKAENIYYPNKLNIEQTSSEQTAAYKAALVSGKSLIDVTGGFGVDTYYFSKQIEQVIHCEINTELSARVAHNFKSLDAEHITCLSTDGVQAVTELKTPLDWIYIDPSRRDQSKQKVFLLTDCAPDITVYKTVFLKQSKNVMIKTSPLLDLTATLRDLEHVKEIHIVALQNEVKELLWILERDFTARPHIKTINLLKSKHQHFDFNIDEESSSIATYSKPLDYLYEPNAAALKSGGFHILSQKLKVDKLHQHAHLYTSNTLLEFPGRRFKIEKVLPYNKKALAKEKIVKANITTRHFPIPVKDLRKKFKIKDGGEIYLFFTTDTDNSKIVIVCSKV